MKIVLNRCFGGFGLSEFAVETLGLSSSSENIPRTDPRLIELVEKDSKKASGPFARLRVIEIPENCTDWEINDYDGSESLICVVDGKLRHIYK